MKTQKPILLADDLKDGSESDNDRRAIASNWAKFLAHAEGSELHAVTVLDSETAKWTPNTVLVSDFVMPGLVKYRADEKGRLEEFARTLKAKPVFLEGSPVAELEKIATPKNYHAIVLGTHGFTGIKRMFLGSVAEEIIRSSPIPVLVVGPQAQERKAAPPKSPPLKILLVTDFGPNSKPAEKFAVELARKTEAEVTAVHCVYQGQDPMVQMALNTPEGQRALAQVFDDLIHDAKKKMSAYQKAMTAKGIKCHGVCDDKAALAYKTILRNAEKFGADLIVMGTHSRSLLGKAFFGSTTRETILNSPIPVVTVRD